jgi:Icc-related predicted phosphoesterase
MSVHWIEKSRKNSCFSVFYQKENESEWKQIYSSSLEKFSTCFISTTYFVKQAFLTDLDEDTCYRFYVEGDKEIYRFRTLSTSPNTPLKIAIGGDFTDNFNVYRKMNRVAAQKNPDFAVLGGDIAYAWNYGINIGSYGSAHRWVSFFVEWQKSMIAEGNRMIPVAAIVGNHDVSSLDRKQKGEHALFLKFFPSEQGSTYRTVDLSLVSFFLLDTGHLFPIDGRQTSWLYEQLKSKAQVTWKIPIYHVPAYPAVSAYKNEKSRQARKCWVPLFELFGVKLAFEHHGHFFKRTHSLLRGEIDDSGIVYIGDGGWGASPRKKSSDHFYLAKKKASSSFCLLTVTPSALRVDAYDEHNVLIDTWESQGI